MRITDVIGYVDRIKPNAFTDEDKARWLSEVEGLVWAEVFLLAPEEFRPYVMAASYTLSGACYPDEKTVRLPAPIPDEFSAGGILTITGGVLYAGNAGIYRIRAISADGCEITVYETFAVVGREEDTGNTTLAFDGSETVLMVRAPHDKIYAAYLTAMIDYGNGEYNKYNNSMVMFNGYWSELCRWVARTFRPADFDPTKRLSYVSAYGSAVRHGYAGTEEEWLRTLHGAAGSSGIWISENEEDAPDSGDVYLWINLGDDLTDAGTPIPTGIRYRDGAIVLMDASEPVGEAVPVQIGLPDVDEGDEGAVLMAEDGIWVKTILSEWSGGEY